MHNNKKRTKIKKKLITITLKRKHVFKNRKNNVVQFLYMKLKKKLYKRVNKKINRNQSNKDQIRKKIIYYELKLKMKFKTNKKFTL